MAVILTLLPIATLLAFIFTRESRVNIIKGDVWRVEIHFTLIAVYLIEREEKDSERKSKRKTARGTKTPISFYPRLWRNISAVLDSCEVEIRELTVPALKNEIARASFTSPSRYRTAISAFLAYIETKSKKLTIKDNAINLIPDDDNYFRLNISFKLPLFNLVRTVRKIIHDKRELKERKKENVGN